MFGKESFGVLDGNDVFIVKYTVDGETLQDVLLLYLLREFKQHEELIRRNLS